MKLKGNNNNNDNDQDDDNNNNTPTTESSGEHILHRRRLADDVLEELLLACEPEYPLLDRRRGDEAVHDHVARLSDAVAAVLRLLVQLRVPVAVVEHDGVCRRQRDSETAGVRGEEEDKALWVRAKTRNLQPPSPHKQR